MNPLFTKHALSDPLSVVLPTKQQTLFLDACLSSKEQGRQAWTMWRESVDDPIRFLGQRKQGCKSLLPLLFAALNRNEIQVEKSLLTYLRTAYIMEETRNVTFRKISRSVFASFKKEGIQAIALKGTALADLVYENPVLRHCHAIDIFIGEADPFSAIRLLSSLKFELQGKMPDPNWSKFELYHVSDLPVVLHRQLFRIPLYNTEFGDLWARSEEKSISDTGMRVLSVSDNLLHLWGDAACSAEQGSLGWVCDSWLIINNCGNLDWDYLLHCATRRHLTLPLSVILSYLAEQLHAPIPARVLQQVHTSALGSAAIACDAALFGARVSARGGFKNLFRMTRNWRSRVSLLRWMILPSLSYLRWIEPTTPAWMLPLFYFYRPVKYMGHVIRGGWRRLFRRFGRKRNILITRENV